jgi:hypothetical protein
VHFVQRNVQVVVTLEVIRTDMLSMWLMILWYLEVRINNYHKMKSYVCCVELYKD